jgi:hypothetical protein
LRRQLKEKGFILAHDLRNPLLLSPYVVKQNIMAGNKYSEAKRG